MRVGESMRELKWKGLLALFGFLAAAFVFKQFQGGFVSGFLFYFLLGFTLLELALLVSLLSSVKVHRHIGQQQLTAGQNLQVEIEVEFNRPLFLLWVSIEDVVPQRVEPQTSGNRIWQIVGAKKHFYFEYEIAKIPRGEHHFNEVVIHVGDLFGFFQKTYKEQIPSSVLVYPSYQELRSFRSINEKNTGITYSLNRTAEDVTSVMGIRNYVNGDRLSRIHWKATARTGQLKTKEFEYHVTNDFMFFIDCERRSYHARPHLFERSVSLAATLIKYALQNRFTAGLALFQEDELLSPLSRSPEQLVRLFTQLARIEANSLFPFAKFLMKQLAYIPFGTTAMVLTSRVDQELVKALTMMRMKKISVELFWILDRLSNSDKEILHELTREGVSIHLIDSNDLLDSLKGVSSSGQVS